MDRQPAGDAIEAKLNGYSADQRAQLMALRALILDVAATTAGVGALEETLKWGQRSCLTTQTGSGATVRIDAHPSGGTALYVNCQTSLIDTFRETYANLTYEGNRAVVFAADETIPKAPVRHMIGLALTYHARKRRKGPHRATAAG